MLAWAFVNVKMNSHKASHEFNSATDHWKFSADRLSSTTVPQMPSSGSSPF